MIINRQSPIDSLAPRLCKLGPCRRPHASRGYTLLFAVIVSVLVLSIAAFILSISRKEAILASSARDSIYAFYAADSGLECAVENLANLATSSAGSFTIMCGGKPITVTQNPPGTAPGGAASAFGTSTFSMLTGTGSVFGAPGSSNSQSTQSGAASCASTSVSYDYQPGSGSVATSTLVSVEVRGYNIGWDGIGTCNITGPRKVERALLYTVTE
jgi:Tfp pilus assembly protein PilX